MKFFTLDFHKEALELAIRGSAHTFIIFVGGSQFNAFEFDWLTAAAVAAGGFILSYATSLAGKDGTPMLKRKNGRAL